MTPLRKFPALLVLAASLVAIGASAATEPAPTRASAAARPRNVILMIPDGCGWASITLARIVAGHPLALDGILVGACETQPTDELITDSAAAATAYASGIKTSNKELGQTWDHKPVATVLEAAQARGMATGLVATSRITHATPAAFASHEAERDSELTIAVEECDHRIDVMLGGGRAQFLPRATGGGRGDGRDLLDEARRRGVAVIASRAELRAELRTPVLGLFAPDHMSYEIERDTLAEPSLTEMTRHALALLARHRGGFFVMIEGSRVDHAAHVNDAPTHVREVLAYDEAVAAALEFARRDGRTLVISVSDHECGGLTAGAWSDRERRSILEPAVLRGAHASAARMAGEIRDGGAVAAVLARGAGITDLSAAEAETLRVAGTRGGLAGSIGTLVSRRAGVGWTTWSHTAADVGLYAFGPGAARLRGVHQNTDVALVIAALLQLDLDGMTAKLRKAALAPPARR